MLSWRQRVKNFDEELDKQFQKTLEKIESDINDKVDEAIDQIERGSVKKVKLEVKEFVDLVEIYKMPRPYWYATNLPVIKDDFLVDCGASCLYSRDEYHELGGYGGKYSLRTHDTAFAFRFYDGHFLTKTGRLLRKCLFERFAGRNIKLSFKRMDPHFLYDTGVRIKIVCNEKSTRRNL